MARSLPPLNALRAFEAAGRYESFSRAAEELGVSHSSISRHVRGLEDRLGVQLFRDLPRGLALSPEGAAYLAQVTPALDAIGEATEGLAEASEGTVTVNAETLFAAKWLVPRLGAFRVAYPGIDIRIEASRRLADIARYEADFAIRFVRPGAAYANADVLSDAPLRPFAAPALFAKPPDDIREFLAHPLLRDRPVGTWQRWFARAGGVAPYEVIEAEHRMSAFLEVEAAIAGQGIILVSEEVVSLEAEGGRLMQLSDIAFREGGYHLVRGEGVLRRKAARIFREWMLAETAQWRGQRIDNQLGG